MWKEKKSLEILDLLKDFFYNIYWKNWCVIKSPLLIHITELKGIYVEYVISFLCAHN